MRQEKIEIEDDADSIYRYDPDGNLVEIAVYKSGERNDQQRTCQGQRI